MTNPANPADRSEDANPANQTDEKFGTIKGQQRTDHTPKGTDTPRGSEVETRNSSNRRG